MNLLQYHSFKILLTAILTFSLSLFEAVLAQSPSLPTNSGLVGWWPFNGNTLDESGNNNHALSFSATFTLDRHGMPNSAIQLGSGVVQLPQSVFSPTFTSSFSISFWFTHSASGNDRLVSTECPEGNFRIANWGGNGIFATQFGDYIVDTLTNPSQWNHYTFTYNNRSVKIYLNGLLVSQAINNSNEPVNYCQPFCVGAKASQVTSDLWDGKIDDIGIWNRALSDSEVMNLFTSLGATNCSSRIFAPIRETCPNQSIVLSAIDMNSSFDSTDYIYLGTFSNSKYYIDNSSKLWTASKNKATAAGGNLVIINDQSEQLFINSLLTKIPSSVKAIHIGLYQDLTSTSYSEPSGGWRWIDGTSPTYLNWHLLEPNNGNVENHGMLWPIGVSSAQFGTFTPGKWNDFNGDASIYWGSNTDYRGLVEVPICRTSSQWSTGDTSKSIVVAPSQTTKYTLYRSGFPQVVLDSVTIKVSSTKSAFSPYGKDSIAICSTTATLDAGPGFLTYSWSNGGNSRYTTASSSGWYVINVTDSIGCIGTDSVYVYRSSLTATVSIAAQVGCHNSLSGSLNLNITGGRAPYTALWSNGSTSLTSISSIGAGTYWVKVTDAIGCVRYDTAVIVQPQAPVTLSTTAQSVLCFGQSTGSIVLSVSGGTPPYSFLWSNGAVSPNLLNVPAGNYSVIVTDANGCQSQASASITQPLSPVSPIVFADSVICFGGSTGSIFVTVSGGVPPYQFIWSNGSTNDSLINVSSGYYSVQVTDANGCSILSGDTVHQSLSPLSYASSKTDASCFGSSNGSIQVIPNGGTSPFRIIWRDANTSFTRSGLTAGWYAFSIYDAIGCSIHDSVWVNQPGTPLSAVTSSINVSCHGGVDGSVAAVGVGGTPPYTYTWLTNPTQIGNALVNVPAGIYPLSVLDANGCQFNTSIVVNQPQPISVNLSTQNVQCFGQQTGYASVTTTGGTPGYLYSWDGLGFLPNSVRSGLDTGLHYVLTKDSKGCVDSTSFRISGPNSPIVHSATAIPVSCHGLSNGSASVIASGGSGSLQITWNTVPVTVGQSLVNVSAGTYQYTIIDLVHGCTVTGSVVVSQPQAPLVANHTQINVSCFGGTTGSALVSPSGGTAPYQISWTPSAVSGMNPTNLAAGWYRYSITDLNGCSYIDSIEIKQPNSAIVITTGVSHVACFGGATGSVWASATGGVGPHTYSWSGIQNTNDTLQGLASGSYQVYVVDSLGCTATSIVVVNQPAMPLTTAITSQSVLCFGGNSGTATVLAQGGTGPYTYLWNNPSSSTSPSINQLSTGWYKVTVTDQLGCSKIDSVFVSQPTAPLSVQSGSTQASCFGTFSGSAWVTAQGGTGPYSYLWPHNGSTNDSIFGQSSGNYLVQVRDANQCLQTINIFIGQPSPLSAILSFQNILCHGDSTGMINVSPQGGAAPYTILWNTGDTSLTLTDLIAGTYSALITDSLGCSDSISIQLSQPFSLISTVGFSSNATCFGANDGSIQVVASGGTGPYSYSLNGQTSVSQGVFNNLSSGTFMVTITDVNGCSVIDTFVVNEPTQILVSPSVKSVTCAGNSDAEIKLNVSGGTSAYNVAWSNGSSGPDLYNLSGGWYHYSITDGNGCGMADSIFVSEPDSLTLNYSVIQPECARSFDGSINFSAAGGSGSYTYAMNGNPSNGLESNLGLGSYSISAIDNNGCSTSLEITLNAQRNPCIEIPNWFSPNGNGENETWIIQGFEFGTYKLIVVNVWGQKVYETDSDNYVPWDGTLKGDPLPNGDYYYVISSTDKTEPTFTGYVTILR